MMENVAPTGQPARKPRTKRLNRAELLALLRRLPANPVPLAVAGAAHETVRLLFWRGRVPTPVELDSLDDALKDLEQPELARETADGLIEVLSVKNDIGRTALGKPDAREARSDLAIRVVKIEEHLHRLSVGEKLPGEPKAQS